MAAKELYNTSLFLDANLQAYYRFSSGGLTTDNSGKGKTLTNDNSVSEVTGKFGGGASGNGGNYLSINDNLSYSGGAYSISFWLKLNAELSTGFYYLIGVKDSGTQTVLWLRYDYNGGTRRIAFRRTRSRIVDTEFTYNITLGTSNWNHLVITYDGGTVRGYINGSIVGSVGASGTGSGTDASYAWILTSGGEYATNGIEDDVAFFNRTLSETEISNLYNGNYPDRIPGVKTNWFM